ncbi:MAG TPA: hypothetical protein VJS30_03365 [Paraburkholderia sp.]|nr:hypothetical protein [Paraburkholderia sp.]
MEETRTTIHSGLTRRNKFLRENPQSRQIVALVVAFLWQAEGSRAVAAPKRRQII